MRPKHYAYLILTIIALSVIVGFSSCNIKKGLTKTKVETETTIVSKTETVREISETIDTNIVIMVDTVTGTSWDLATDPITTETGDIKLIVTKDKSGQYHATAIQKGKVIPVYKRKLTVERIDESKKVEVESLVETKHKTKDSESAVKFNMNWIWVIIGGALVLYFGYWFVFVRKKEEKK